MEFYVQKSRFWEGVSCTIPIPVPGTPSTPSLQSPPQPIPLCVLIHENSFILIPHLSRALPASVLLFRVPAFAGILISPPFWELGLILNFFFFCFLYFWHQREFHGRVQIAETNNLFCFEGLFQSSLVRFFLKKNPKTLLAAGNLGQKTDSPVEQECP